MRACCMAAAVAFLLVAAPAVAGGPARAPQLSRASGPSAARQTPQPGPSFGYYRDRPGLYRTLPQRFFLSPVPSGARSGHVLPPAEAAPPRAFHAYEFRARSVR